MRNFTFFISISFIYSIFLSVYTGFRLENRVHDNAPIEMPNFSRKYDLLDKKVLDSQGDLYIPQPPQPRINNNMLDFCVDPIMNSL